MRISSNRTCLGLRNESDKSMSVSNLKSKSMQLPKNKRHCSTDFRVLKRVRMRMHRLRTIRGVLHRDSSPSPPSLFVRVHPQVPPEDEPGTDEPGTDVDGDGPLQYMSKMGFVTSNVFFYNLHTKFLTGCGPMDEKSTAIGAILSSFASPHPAASRPFLHILAYLSTRMLAELVVVHSKPPGLTSGAASATSSSMSCLTDHRFFFFPPTLVLGGSRMTMSYCSPRFPRRANQSKQSP